MSRLFLPLLLAGLPAVFAQQATEEPEPPIPAPGAVADPCAEFDPQAVQDVLDGKVPSGALQPDANGIENAARQPLSKACLEHLETQRKAEETRRAGGQALATGEDGDSQPSDEDFTPDEEISEDYPVPLPSDI